MRFRFPGDDRLTVINTMCDATPDRCRWGCGNQCAHPAPNESSNETFDAVARRYISRRRLLAGGLAAGALLVVRTNPLAAATANAAAPGASVAQSAGALTFSPVSLNEDDRIVVPAGYTARTLIRWGDPLFLDGRDGTFVPGSMTLERQLRTFGYNNDYVGYFPLPEDHRGLLVVNHEYTNPELMFAGYDADNPAKEQADIELAAHGMTIVHLERHAQLGWRYTIGAWHNRRIHGFSRLMLTGPAAGHALLRTSGAASGQVVEGMLNNCGAGRTPWGTVLTCEENFNQYFANNDNASGAVKAVHARYGLTRAASERKWERFYDRFDIAKEPNEPFRYGWVVEIDPYDPTSLPRKRTALGRFKHEATSTVIAKSGQAVVYMGDDERFDYMYKFVSAGTYNPDDRHANGDLLDSGTLFVAKFNDDGSGTWLPLVHGQGNLTAANGFADQGEVLIKARLAGDAVGATKMDRPEDIEVNPVTGKVYAVMTNNSNRGTGSNPGPDGPNPRASNRSGHIIELTPGAGDHGASTFGWNLFMVCGDGPADGSTYFAGFDRSLVSPISCPDNITFDAAGNLWIATDGLPAVLPGHDGIFAVPTAGPERGHVRQFLSSVTGCETASLVLNDANDTLFVTIQHPGEGSTFDAPSSSFPDGGSSVPRPAVVFVMKDSGGVIGS